jgi:hypothetical protein
MFFPHRAVEHHFIRASGTAMTLLISAKFSDGILVTADGRSNLTTSAGHSVKTETLQKIFPHRTLPVALAHHGENVLDGQSVEKHITSFLTSLGATDSDVDTIAIKLLTSLDSLVSKNLLGSHLRKYCGFWLLGKAATAGFVVYEVDWCKTRNGLERKAIPHGALLLGGDCAQPIKQFLSAPINGKLSHNKLLSSDRDYAKALSDELYNRVLSTGPKTCGGHKHQLLISAASCTWVEPPV